MQYQARMTVLQMRLARSNVEETLYHGTDEQTCDKINRHGFNRSFCGKNGNFYLKYVQYMIRIFYWTLVFMQKN